MPLLAREIAKRFRPLKFHPACLLQYLTVHAEYNPQLFRVRAFRILTFFHHTLDLFCLKAGGALIPFLQHLGRVPILHFSPHKLLTFFRGGFLQMAATAH